ncbi:gustatory receptor for sugar taste 64f-like [Bombyx mandarina]|uniref:Gustatory receptor n=1 Tax=Bombyx mandarina TaxID=7092 RepID=A0A6J2K6V8_BOMMA|nr:gustatory receptor for sugar taste 64f-like [Bombyx mandarina]
MVLEAHTQIQYCTAKANYCEFHAGLRHLMRLARWAGFFPVQGLSQANPDDVRFEFRSLYALYHAITVIGQTVMTFLAFYSFVDSNVSLSVVSNFLFYFTNYATLVLLWRLSKNWSALISKTLEFEQSVTEIRTTRNLVSRTNTLTYVVLIFALIEHALSKVFNIRSVMCCLGETSFNHTVFNNYFKFKWKFVFDYFSTSTTYSFFVGFIAEFLCMQATFLWSFTDVLIMCFSIYLSSFFEDFNNTVSSFKKKASKTVPWSTLRVQYSQIVLIVKQMDEQLDYFVLISYFTNLFFICFQLYNSLNRIYDANDVCNENMDIIATASFTYLTYYVFSFLFLVTRALLLSIMAANVHSCAQVPQLALYEVPTADYSLDVQRFQLQLRYTTVGLSGVCFNVTRGMILRVIGTIVTYELVLIQLTKKNLDNDTSIRDYYLPKHLI